MSDGQAADGPSSAASNAHAAQSLLDAWQRGEQPDWLPPCANIPATNWLERLAVLRVDLDRRWRMGQRGLLEEYLQRLPSLADDVEQVLDLAASEHILRQSLGESPPIDEYCGRFPKYAAALREMFGQQQAFDDTLSHNPDGNHALPDRSPPVHLFWASASRQAAESATDSDQQTIPSIRPAALAGAPEMVGDYRLEGILGRGGMGIVYKARDRRLKRLVAIKMLSTAGSADDLARFRGEAEMNARLQHPHIVQIFEVGQHEGRLYLVLELVSGGSLSERLKGVPLAAREAAQLVATLAEAVHYGHREGIVHRDLKPANVLLTAADEPKVSDFGLAKSTDQPSDQTQSGAVIGTPSYMAPEQASGEGKSAGPTVDIYALGAILYEALTGRPPFRGQTTLDTLDQVRNAEPVAPAKLQPKLPRDLNTICLKCLEKSPGKRYASAQELADDLRRYLRGEPIQARPVNTVERLLKWTRRRPALAAMGALSAACLLALAVGGVLYSVSLRKALRDVALQRDEARRQTEIANERLDHTRRGLIAMQLTQVAAFGPSDPVRGLQTLDDDSQSPTQLRDFTWRHLHRACSRQVATVDLTPLSLARCLAISNHGDLAAVGGQQGEVFLVDLTTHQPQRMFQVHDGAVNCLSFSRDDRFLLSGGSDGQICVCRLEDHQRLDKLQETGDAINALTFSADGSTLAAGGTDQSVQLWDWPSRQPRRSRQLDQGSIFSLAFSPDGKHLAIGLKNERAQIWNLADDLLQPAAEHNGWATCVAWSPDGQTLASGSMDRTIRLWDTAKHESKQTLSGHDALVSGLVWTADGQSLASTSYDRTLIVWNVSDGTPQITFRSQRAEITPIAVLPPSNAVKADDKRPDASPSRLVSVSGSTMHDWDLQPSPGRSRLAAHNRPVTALAFVPGGAQLVSAGYDRKRRLWDVAAGKPVGEPIESTHWISAIACADDGRLALGGADGAVKLLPSFSDPSVRTLDAQQLAVSGLAFLPDGRRLVTWAAGESRIGVWNLESGEKLADLPTPGDAAVAAACGFDSRRIVVASEAADRASSLFIFTLTAANSEKPSTKSAVDKSPAAPFHRAAMASAVACSAHAQRIAVAYADGAIVVLDASSLKPLRTLTGHQGAVLSLAFSPDGQTLVSGGSDQTVRFWDHTIGQPRLIQPLGHGSVNSIVFSADGRTLATGHDDGRVEIWHTDEKK